MSHHDDLPLFRWTPPQVEVIPFPCRSRVGKIRRTAEYLTGSTQRGRDAYWRRAVTDLTNQMRRAGIADDRIDQEIADFRDGVEAELRRLVYRGHSAMPGGDAA